MRLVSRLLAALSACLVIAAAPAYDVVFSHDAADAVRPVVAVDDTTGDVFVGYTVETANGRRFRAFRFDPSGTEIWSTTIQDGFADGFRATDMATNGQFLVVTGEQDGGPSAKGEMATINLRANNGSFVWLHTENTNFLPDVGQHVRIVGDSAYAAGSVGSGFVGARMRLADGLKLWQRTFPGMDGVVGQRVGIEINPTGDVYLAGTRQPNGNAASNIVLVRMTQDGQVLSERLLNANAEFSAMCRTFDGQIVTAGSINSLGVLRPFIARWNAIGIPQQAFTFGTDTGRIATVAAASGPGFVHIGIESGLPPSTSVSLGTLNGTFGVVSGFPPGQGVFGQIQEGVGGVLVSILSVRQPNSLIHFGRIFSIPPVDGFNLVQGGIDIKAIDLALDSRLGRHVVAFQLDGSPDSIAIRSLNPRPQANPDTFETFRGETLSVPAPGVLGNDIGGAGATAVAVNPPQGLTLNLDGSFDFTPAPGFDGVVTFDYTAQRGTGSSTSTVTLHVQPALASVEMDAPVVVGGQPATGKVNLTGPRLLTPAAIAISEDSAFAVPSSPNAAVAVGATQGTFSLITAATRESRLVTVSATLRGVVATTQFTIRPPQVTRLVALRPTIIGGALGRFRVELDGVAPTNGIAVSLSDDSTAILAPAAVAVPAGQTSAEFDAPTAPVTTSRTAVVTATLGTSASATVGIVGLTLTVNPTSVVGGVNATGTITLTSNAIGQPIVFDLTDDSPATGFAAPTATIAAGTLSVNFNIITAAVPTDRTATITATGQGIARTAQLRVLAPALQAVAMNPTQVRGGQNSTGTVTLTGRAPAGGIVVTLQAGAAIVQVPASVTVAAGQSTANFTATTNAVNQTLMITIAARHNGITRTTTLILTP
ncbi:MAG: hypothetical protein IT363_04585 [Methanoregulaceae archaeon]|nr:hypothetical protein [Methanoregulaceae archaeon]